MSIPAERLVSVSATATSSFGSSLELDGLFLSCCPYVETDTVLAFSSLEEVQTFFSSDSDECLAAAAYFDSFVGSPEKPALFQVFRYDEDSGIAGFLRGSSPIDDTSTLTNGAITIAIDGSSITRTGIDFSSAITMEDVAQILEDALNGALPSELHTAEANWIPGGGGTRALVYPDARYGLENEPSILAFSVANTELLSSHLSLELPDDTYGSNSHNGFVPIWIVTGSGHESTVISQANTWMHNILGESATLDINYVDLEFATAFLLCSEGYLEALNCNFKIWWLND